MTYSKQLRDAITRAATLIADADAVLIVAGAGMGIDSGLPDYRGPNGLWNTWHPAAQLRMTYEDLSTHEQFVQNPALAWGFQTYLTRMYHDLDPHSGYHQLRELVESGKQGQYFVVTSNVDSQFLKAGFDPDKLYEVHGTKRVWQCMSKKCNKRCAPWPMDVTQLPELDPETLLAIPPFPKCMHCGAMARPNVSFFDDDVFSETITKRQGARFQKWLESVVGTRVVLLEFGCGLSQHSIRFEHVDGRYAMQSKEYKLPPSFRAGENTHLIRINPDDGEDMGPHVVNLPLGAQEAMRVLASRV